MTKDELNRRYFEWMYQFARNSGCFKRSYRTLFALLHHIDFTYTIPMDGNREADGIDLRYRFGYEYSYSDSVIASYLDDRPCSVLEMLVALAKRCEEHIMDDPDFGDRTGLWLWRMLSNLGLDKMSDEHFDKTQAEDAIFRFLNREYAPDGTGGLFTVKRCRRDLRSVDIWYQMCWYLDEIM